MTGSPLESRIRQARRRLFSQVLLNRLGLAWGAALALGLVWFLVSPFVLRNGGPENLNLKWMILGGAGLLGTALAIWSALRVSPTPLTAALAIDQRFELQERVTTAVGLDPHQQSSPAGQALLADANARLEKIAVKGKFPVRLGWRALFIPAQAAAIVLLALYPPPILTMLAGGESKKDDDSGKTDDADARPKPSIARPFIKPPLERPNKSEELRQLEAELAKLYDEHNRDTTIEKDRPENVRVRQEKIATAEDKLKKREQEMAEKFQRLQEQMDKLTEIEHGEARPDGPAKGLEDALANGDLQKAQEEVDRLKKKARDKKLDNKEQEQLKNELKDVEDRVERLTREQEKKKEKLKDLIDKAKKENRDAETLERELQKLEQEQQMTKEMQELAKSLKAAKQALDMNDFDGLADQLDNVSKQLGGIQDELQDLEDIQEHLQNLKQMKKEGCKECQGEGEGKGGEPKDTDSSGKGRQEGATGSRPENKDAKTKEGEEKRVRGFFDPKGRKAYGGSTNGPAFKKASSAEMSKDIQQAAQDAPEAVEVQRLPKAAKDMVKEYFEKLGGQAPPKK
jgi:hypothetical protein